MRFSILALGAVCAVASAQSLGDIPQCALACFAAAVPASGCSLTDQKCQCTTGKSKIEDSITQCVPGKCSAEDIAKLAPAVTKLCAAAGVTISDLPTSAAATESGASKTASGSVSTTASATSGSASSTTSAPAQSTGGAVANGVSIGAVALGVVAAFGF